MELDNSLRTLVEEWILSNHFRDAAKLISKENIKLELINFCILNCMQVRLDHNYLLSLNSAMSLYM